MEGSAESKKLARILPALWVQAAQIRIDASFDQRPRRRPSQGRAHGSNPAGSATFSRTYESPRKQKYGSPNFRLTSSERPPDAGRRRKASPPAPLRRALAVDTPPALSLSRSYFALPVVWPLCARSDGDDRQLLAI